MKPFVLTFFFLLGMLPLSAQQHPLAKQLFDQINQARTNPTAFLEANEAALKRCSPTYANKLKSMKPIEPVVWNADLEKMARSVVENGTLSPEYKGEQKLCGRSSGRSSGAISQASLDYLCDFYTNVHDPDYQFLGLYFNKDLNGYAFQWGIRCQRTRYEYTFEGHIDSSMVDFSALNTAKDEDYLTEVEKRMVLEVNFVRAYPKVYADIIADYLESASTSWPYLDKDELDAGLELIEELRALTPVQILEPKRCVYTAAQKHGKYSQQRGYFSHTGAGDSSPWERITAACSDVSNGNENGAGNSAVDPRIPVIALLLDAGITSRGHRYNMLDAKWKYIGVYRYDDPKYNYFWVQNFAY
ncbi:MAG: CAP domain-containing protein [Bacteroidota bacterium]